MSIKPAENPLMTSRDETDISKQKARNGGPAFPFEGRDFIWTGLTIRDAFAIGSLNAFALDMSDPDISFDDVAHNAYMLADALLKARSEKEE